MMQKNIYDMLIVRLIVFVNLINLIILISIKFTKIPFLLDASNVPALMVIFLFLIATFLTTLFKRNLKRRQMFNLGIDIHLVIFLYLLTIDFNLFSNIGFFVVALITSIVGIPMAYVPQNHFIGVRIYWTYLSEDNWYRTNILAARLLSFSGMLPLILDKFVPGTFLPVFIALNVLFIAYIIFYSYNLSKKIF